MNNTTLHPNDKCHIHSCQTPTDPYCREQASDFVEMFETGAWLELCQAHMLECLREGYGQPVQPIPAEQPGWVIA